GHRPYINLTLVNSHSNYHEIEIIHMTTVVGGVSICNRIETLLKSIFVFHKGIIHFHFIADSQSQQVLSTLLQTWSVPNLRWSLYDLEATQNTLQWVKTSHRNTMGQIKLVIDEILPLYVEEVILLDTDMIMLGDVRELQNYVVSMRRSGALYSTSEDMYQRTTARLKYPHKGYGENTGTTLYNLKKMREMNWKEMWRAEADRLLRMIGPLMASEQDIFTSLAVYRPEIHQRMPCVYNFQMGWGALQTYCIPKRGDLIRVKIPHWTGGEKWAENKGYLPYFNKLYKCIQKLDGSRFQDPKLNQTIQYPRTLLNMLTAEITTGEVTMAVHTLANQGVNLIQKLGIWPGPVSLVLFGTDLERAQLNDYLNNKNKKENLPSNVELHFVYQTDRHVDYPHFYMKKMAVDSSKSDNVLLIDEIEELPISKDLFNSVVAKVSSSKFEKVAHMLKSDRQQPLGTLMKRLTLQRIITQGIPYEDGARSLKLKSIDFEIVNNEEKKEEKNRKVSSFPHDEFCEKEIVERQKRIRTQSGK
ncbi:hypothetical protein PRIPAC_73781, partial [Pristionchus pacificus]